MTILGEHIGAACPDAHRETWRILSLIEGKRRILKSLCCFGVQEDINRVLLIPIAHLAYGNDNGRSYFFVDYILFP